MRPRQPGWVHGVPFGTVLVAALAGAGRFEGGTVAPARPVPIGIARLGLFPAAFVRAALFCAGLAADDGLGAVAWATMPEELVPPVPGAPHTSQ